LRISPLFLVVERYCERVAQMPVLVIFVWL
jgi:hypothetical protein